MFLELSAQFHGIKSGTAPTTGAAPRTDFDEQGAGLKGKKICNIKKMMIFKVF